MKEHLGGIARRILDWRNAEVVKFWPGKVEVICPEDHVVWLRTAMVIREDSDLEWAYENMLVDIR